MICMCVVLGYYWLNDQFTERQSGNISFFKVHYISTCVIIDLNDNNNNNNNSNNNNNTYIFCCFTSLTVV